MAVLVTAVAALAAALPAHADSHSGTISERRAEARRLEREIEELGRRASLVLEDYHETAARYDEASARLANVRNGVLRLRREVTATSEVADLRIAAMYRNSGATVPTQLSLVDSATVTEYGVGEHYAELLAAEDRRTIDRLTVRRRDLARHEHRLEAEAQAVAEEKEALAARQEQVEEAMSARQRALNDARGDVARLVEAEQRRRAAEEARRAREALAARQRAEEEARRRAAREAELAPDPTLPEEVAAPEEPDEPDGPPPAVHGAAAVAVDEAKEQLGKPYQWGGSGPDTFDCSGLTAWAWAAAGVELPHSSRAQYASLPHVSFDDLQPGDLVFYGDPIHHVGIYAGNGQMVNAPYTGSHVRYDSIYRDDFAGAGRPG